MDVDAAGREHDVVRVPRDRVGGLLVDRPPLVVEPPERLLVLRERPVARRAPAPRPCRRRPRRAPSSRARGAARRVASDPSAPPPSAITFGSRADSASTAASSSISRKADSPQERKISAIESPARASISRSTSTNGAADALGGLRPERRLAGPHEADQRDVPV